MIVTQVSLHVGKSLAQLNTTFTAAILIFVQTVVVDQNEGKKERSALKKYAKRERERERKLNFNDDVADNRKNERTKEKSGSRKGAKEDKYCRK